MGQTNRKAIQRNVSLREDDINIVEQVRQTWGLDFSAALRFIIRDWAAHRRGVFDGRGRSEGATVEVRTPPSDGALGAGE